MFLMHSFSLAGHAKVKVWANHTLEPDPKDVLLTTIAHHTRVGCVRVLLFS